jgi:hypothetical protein
MTLPQLIAAQYAGNISAFARALAAELSADLGRPVRVNPTTARRWLLDPADRHYRTPSPRYRKAIKRLSGDRVDVTSLLREAA